MQVRKLDLTTGAVTTAVGVLGSTAEAEAGEAEGVPGPVYVLGNPGHIAFHPTRPWLFISDTVRARARTWPTGGG
jgi:hypothetical protein